MTTCTKTIVARTRQPLTIEITPWGDCSHEVIKVVTELHWQGYDSKVSEFITYNVATYDRGRYMGSYVTADFPDWADYSPEGGA